MWPLVAAGILTGAFCIDACVTIVIVVISVAAVALSKPIPESVERSVARSSSARRASTVEGESDSGEVGTESKTEKKEQVAPTKREMTANPRRTIPSEATPATETVSTKTVHAAPSHGAFVGARGRDAQLRLMQAMKKEMISARLHQFERPRITSPPTE